MTYVFYTHTPCPTPPQKKKRMQKNKQQQPPPHTQKKKKIKAFFSLRALQTVPLQSMSCVQTGKVSYALRDNSEDWRYQDFLKPSIR